jgi:hypothetical protein
MSVTETKPASIEYAEMLETLAKDYDATADFTDNPPEHLKAIFDECRELGVAESDTLRRRADAFLAGAAALRTLHERETK